MNQSHNYPWFDNVRQQLEQSEAKQILKQVYTLQRAYRQEFNTYADDGVTAAAAGNFPVLGVEIMDNARYSYVMAADSTTFTCTATGNLDDDGTDDVWTIDETGDLQNTSNDATS